MNHKREKETAFEVAPIINEKTQGLVYALN